MYSEHTEECCIEVIRCQTKLMNARNLFLFQNNISKLPIYKKFLSIPVLHTKVFCVYYYFVAFVECWKILPAFGFQSPKARLQIF